MYIQIHIHTHVHIFHMYVCIGNFIRICTCLCPSGRLELLTAHWAHVKGKLTGSLKLPKPIANHGAELFVGIAEWAQHQATGLGLVSRRLRVRLKHHYINAYGLGTNSWIIIIIWVYITLNRTPNIDCYWVGAVPNLWYSPLTTRKIDVLTHRGIALQKPSCLLATFFGPSCVHPWDNVKPA